MLQISSQTCLIWVRSLRVHDNYPTTTTAVAPTCHTNKQLSCSVAGSPPKSGTPSPTSSYGSTTWTNSFLGGRQRNTNEYMLPWGELVSRLPQNPRSLVGGTPYPTPGEVCARSSQLIKADCHELAFFTFFSPNFSQHWWSLIVRFLSYQTTYTCSNHFNCSLCSQINRKHVCWVPWSSCQSHSTLWLPTCYERLLVLSNPCWTLPVGCSLVHRGWVESTINLYPAKGKVMVMSAATTSLEWPDLRGLLKVGDGSKGLQKA